MSAVKLFVWSIFLLSTVLVQAQGNKVEVSKLSNFPDPGKDGGITLESDMMYVIHGMVDIGEHYINLNGAGITGVDPGKDGIICATEGAVLRSEDAMVFIENLAIICASKKTMAYDFTDETKSKYVNLFSGCSVLDAPGIKSEGIGKINGFNTICIDLNYWNAKKGLRIGGQIGKFTSALNYITGIEDGAALEFQEDAEIDDIVLTSNYFVYNGSTGIKIKSGAKIDQGRMNLNLFRGQQNCLEGFNSFTPGWQMMGNGSAIPDSRAKAYFYMNENETETVFKNKDMFQKVGGETEALVADKFSADNNRFTYTDKMATSVDIVASVTGTSSFQDGAFTMVIMKNGSEMIVPKTHIGGIDKGHDFQLRLETQTSLKQGDYLEIFLKADNNEDNKPIVITDMMMKINQQ